MNIDAKNAVLGRLATAVSKELMKGNSVNIINADRVIITGNPEKIAEKYLERRRKGNPFHGPYFPRTPDRIVRRTIRGMLPYKTHKGRAAFKRLKVYTSMPKDLENENFNSVGVKDVRSRFITIGKLSKALGWHH